MKVVSILLQVKNPFSIWKVEYEAKVWKWVFLVLDMAYIKLSNDIQRPTSSALVNIFLFELAKKLAQITKTSKGSLLILILNFSFCFYLKKA